MVFPCAHVVHMVGSVICLPMYMCSTHASYIYVILYILQQDYLIVLVGIIRLASFPGSCVGEEERELGTQIHCIDYPRFGNEAYV